MKFITLEIQNFLAIGHGQVKLDDRGLVLIQGVNLDDTSATSNGTGKSTVVDALSWCLFGVTARGISGDAVVNKTAKKETYVLVSIKDGDNTYLIARYRKHVTMKNSTRVTMVSPPTHAAIDITKGTEAETQKVIDQIMGCSLEVFMAAIYAGQEAMPDLPKLTDKQLKLLIEESAGVSRLEGAYAAARLKLNEASGQVAHLRIDLTRFENCLLANKVSEKTAADDFNEFERKRKDKRVLSDMTVVELNKEKSGLVAVTSAYAISATEQRIKDIDKELANHSECVKTWKKVEDDRAVRDRRFVSLSHGAEQDLKAALTLKENLENAAEISKKPCTSCGKPGDEHDLTTYKEHASANLKTALEKAIKSKADAAEAKDTLLSFHRDAAALHGKIPDVTALTMERTKLVAFFDDYKKTMAKIDMVDVEIKIATSRGDSYATEVNPYAAIHTHLIAEATNLETKVFHTRVEIDAAEESLALWTNVVQVFGPAGVRAHILDTVTPFLNERTADYLSALSDGNITAVWSTLTKTAKGDLKEKFNIEVSNDKGAESFAGLSGGEKRKVRLSTMLALQDLVSSRATKNIELFVADEVDDALDPAGLERLMGVLDRKAKDRGTVLVISHNDLESWIPDVCTVTKKDGLSTIDGALS